MNYYIQGDPSRAQEIKAAFEKLGYNTYPRKFTNEYLLYFTLDGKILDCTNGEGFAKIIKSHPDYQELDLPKPHYDIANFKPFDKVLVRACDGQEWRCNWFSHYSGEGGVYRFVTTKCGYAQCIPFEGNEHLLGTTNMPNEEFINW